MKIVLLTGPARAGKSTAANVLVKNHGYRLEKFAGILKEFCSVLGVHYENVEGDKKDEPIDWLGGKSARYIQQTLGTEWGRRMISEDIWAEATVRNIRNIARGTGQELFVIDDTRFPNELDIMTREFSEVRVINIKPEYALYQEIDASEHESEKHNLPWGYQIINRGSVFDLEEQISAIVDADI